MSTQTVQNTNTDYPVNFNVDYPSKRNRLTVAFRLFINIPIAIVALLILSSLVGTSEILVGLLGNSDEVKEAAMILSDILTGFPAFMLFLMFAMLFRGKYPQWIWNFILGAERYLARTTAYTLLLTDDFPSFEDEQGVKLTAETPDPTQMNRWLPLVKWILAIPHYIILAILYVAVVLVTIFAWFSIIVAGKYPRVLFNFTVSVVRWSFRVQFYAAWLATDRYPPFSFD